MLNFDLDGKLIEPTRLKKTLGGDFDTRGIPSDFSVLDTGSYAGVTVASYDEYLAKRYTRTTSGKIGVVGPDIYVTTRMEAACLKAWAIGQGSGATSGQTNRDFLIGFKNAAGTQGAYIEYRSPKAATDANGHYLTTINGSTVTRTPINWVFNNPAEHIPFTFWLVRNPSGGWVVYGGEGDQIRIMHQVDAGDIDTTRLMPRIEWNFYNDPAGSCLCSVSRATVDLYYNY